MKRFTFKTVALMLMTAWGTHAVAYDFQNGKLYYNYIDDGAAVEVTSGDEAYSGTSLSIPATVNDGTKDLPVKAVGSWAFYGAEVKVVTITNGVERLENTSFYSAQGLQAITIPASVNYIGENVFYACRNLKKVDLSKTQLTEIGYKCFSSCTVLTEVKLPSTLKEIGTSAFESCEALTTVNIPDGIEEIPYGCFEGCTSLKSITIPESVISFEQSAFANTGFLSFTLPETVLLVGDNCFDRCENLSTVSSFENVVSMGRGVFENTGLTTIPEGLSELPDDTFSGCAQLTSVNIPHGISSIGSSAFSGCTKLASVTIPSTISEIKSFAFSGCEALISIDLPEGIAELASGLLSGCTNLKALTIPSTVSAIKDNALYNCASLKTIELPAGVTEIGSYAFYNCTGLTSIVSNMANPDGIASEYAFASDDAAEIYTNAQLEIPSGSLELYQKTSPWNKFKNIGNVTAKATISDSGYTVFCWDEPLDISGLSEEVYVVTGVSKTSADLAILGSEVPANTGIIIKGEPGAVVSIPMKASANALPYTNLLKGVNEDTALASEYGSEYNFILVGGKFVRCSGGTLKAHKAYLRIQKSIIDAVSAKEILLNIDCDYGTTGIKNAKQNESSDQLIYNLNGQHVGENYKGVVIVNGKKVLKK